MTYARTMLAGALLLALTVAAADDRVPDDRNEPQATAAEPVGDAMQTDAAPLADAAPAAAATPAAATADTAALATPAVAEERSHLRAQVLLDRALYSPGEIDGLVGSNQARAVAGFQRKHGMADSGQLDDATWAALEADAVATIVDYTLTAADVAGPFMAIPRDMMEKAKLDALGYRDVAEALGEGHRHDAIDIMAALGTPVRAVADGSIAKLFLSVPGGKTIYQFDSDERVAFYYAHLDRYADGIVEGMDVQQGQLIGYVGYTGNANVAAPHLHFAIFVLGADRRWWEGTAINPYPLLQGGTTAAPR